MNWLVHQIKATKKPHKKALQIRTLINPYFISGREITCFSPQLPGN
jgi:hypothetical protein